MSQISYLGKTGIYTGATTSYNFYSPVNIYKGQTSLIFIQCSSVSLHPSYPTDWILVDSVDSTMGGLMNVGTMYCFYCQPTSTLIHPSWTVNGLSPNFNTGYGLFFSGVTLVQSQVINAVTHSANTAGNTGTNGFTTTINKSVVVQAGSVMKHPVSTPYYFETNSWVSTPSLSWTDLYSDISAIKAFSGYGISHGCAISVNVPKNTYTSFDYTLSSSQDNLTIDVALSPVGSKPNSVLNGLESF